MSTTDVRISVYICVQVKREEKAKLDEIRRRKLVRWLNWALSTPLVSYVPF